MSSGNKVFQLVEENSAGSSEVKKDSNKNNIIIELSKKKTEEDDKSLNSAECSGNELKYSQKVDLVNSVKPIKLSKKAYEKYTQKLKENTMRLQVAKMYNETERLKKKYEEKIAYFHSFDNNPQFQKMLKMVGKQLIYFFIQGIFLLIFSALFYFYVTRCKEGLALTSLCLSITEITFSIILFISLKLGLLNDPNLSKAFRLFVVMEFLLLFSSFIINVISGLVNNEYLKKNITEFQNRLIIYIIYLLMILLFIYSFKFCSNLFLESVLILLKRKTEYSILMINERNTKNEINFNINLSTMSNNETTEGLNNANTGIFQVDNNVNNNKDDKEEEQYRTYNYFNKFHYSVTSSRNGDYNNFKKI